MHALANIAPSLSPSPPISYRFISSHLSRFVSYLVAYLFSYFSSLYLVFFSFLLLDCQKRFACAATTGPVLEKGGNDWCNHWHTLPLMHFLIIIIIIIIIITYMHFLHYIALRYLASYHHVSSNLNNSHPLSCPLKLSSHLIVSHCCRQRARGGYPGSLVWWGGVDADRCVRHPQTPGRDQTGQRRQAQKTTQVMMMVMMVMVMMMVVTITTRRRRRMRRRWRWSRTFLFRKIWMGIIIDGAWSTGYITYDYWSTICLYY